MTPLVGRVLGGFNHRVSRKMTGEKTCRGRDMVWVYPLLEVDM